MNVKAMVNNQKNIFQMLKKAKEHDRLSHAYLFYGEEGVGKKEMAYALACLLYCPNGGCLECETCNTILEGNHINVDYIGINETKKMISKEQIVNLQEEFSKTSLIEGPRVYIVDGIDTSSSAAQNSLLKFIEEPVNSTPTVGIFIANELANVVPTILSRCSLQHFEALPIAQSVSILVSEGLNELDATLCAGLSNNLEEAHSFQTSNTFSTLKELFLSFIDLRDSKSAVLYYLYHVNVFSDGKNLAILIKWITIFLEDALFYQTNKDKLLLKGLCDKIEVYSRYYALSLKDKLNIVLALGSKLNYNVTAKNVFHELLIKLVL